MPRHDMMLCSVLAGAVELRLAAAKSDGTCGYQCTDPGQNKALVGIERPDWMRQCNTTGFGHYVGREQVQVGTTNVWADHWSCRLDYAAANQSITFQNWHSLGLDGVPKGLPIRVTGGNSAPNPTRGSPRLNSVWYQNFAFGPSATSPDDFKVPNFGACIPVGAEDVERFFGHPVKPQHLLSPAFHSRAHFLPHARPSTRDLIRAKRPKPTSAAFVGDDFASAMQKLNHVLKRDEGLMVKECGDFSLPALHEMRRLLFDARSPELDDVYLNSSNTRRMAHASVESLDTEHRRHMDLESTSPELAAKARDGACHEAVLWYIHHLSESARAAIKDKLVLPLLPERFHEAPLGQPHPVHIRYQEQASCAICHVKPPASEAITFV